MSSHTPLEDNESRVTDSSDSSNDATRATAADASVGDVVGTSALDDAEPAGGKRAENRRRRVQQIVAAAQRLFLERGVEAVTIDEIVAEAGIAKGSFYRYFRDKTDLVERMFQPMQGAIEAATTWAEPALGASTSFSELATVYIGLTLRLVPALVEEKALVMIYLQESRAPAVGARAPIRRLATLIDAKALALTHVARAQGMLRDISPEVSSRTVVGAVERLIAAHLDGEPGFEDPAAIGTALVSTILDGLRPD